MFDFSLFHLKGQTAGEETIAVIHRHWFNILQKFFAIFFMVLFLIGSYVALPALFPILTKDAFNSIFIFMESLFAMLIWMLFFLIWIDYYFDVWIITNKKIINIEQKGLFIRTVSELELDKIQDITTEVKGVIPTFLNFGDVMIQTAAEKERFAFRQVSNPYGIKDVIMRLEKTSEKQAETEKAATEAREIKAAFGNSDIDNS